MNAPDRALRISRLAALIATGLFAGITAGCGAREPSVMQDSSPPRTSAGTASIPSADRIQFRDMSGELGLHFEYFRGDSGKLWTLEPHGGAAAALDFDGDGVSDLFFVNGKQLPPDPSDRRHLSRLFRNRSGASLEDVAEAAGAAISLYGQGCTSGDYDNDGFADLFVTGWKDCRLLRNQGDGTFRDVTLESGIAPGAWNTGACFADLDRDGQLDLFIAAYLDFDPVQHKPCLNKNRLLGYCGPGHYRAVPDRLYQSDGNGGFRDISASAGIIHPAGNGFGAVAADFDNDEWPDLLVANDGEPNVLWHNRTAESSDHAVAFVNVAIERGIALNADGLPEANMGIACGDYDGDGLVDVGISHFYQEHFTLYKNFGTRGFMDVTQLSGLSHTTRSKMGWGTGFVDFNLDGWLDLFVVNGHINDHPGTPYRMTAQVFHNRAGQRFDDVSAAAGDYFSTPRIGRGTAVTDIDADGRQDLVVVQHHAQAAVLANRTEQPNHRIVLRLVGTHGNRDGSNSRIVARCRDAPERALVREALSGEGYLGSNDLRVWIGLGTDNAVEQLDVRWPSGRVDMFRDVAADREYLLIEDRPLRGIRALREIDERRESNGANRE